jgi:3-phosphoshikimate 1-carboxyvinyltransferase
MKGEITLPSSKSISNRLLIIRAFADPPFDIINLSESDDTAVMLEAFKSREQEINIGHAGTAMRFLTAYFAASRQNKILTGSDRMKNRTISELVESLNQIGAGIQYLGENGFPPIQTSGNALTGNQINIHGGISSQFITALLLIAPVLADGLSISIDGKLISSSYVALTLHIMESFGIKANWDRQTIHIPHQSYRGIPYTVESDWSAASYWYEVAALSDEAEITLHGLHAASFQGDAQVSGLFEKIGVRSQFSDQKVILKKGSDKTSWFECDFNNTPDLVQTFVVTLCLLNIPFRISGAETLRIKETDRITALQTEMKKLGYIIQEPSPGILSWNHQLVEPEINITIDTYNDHRMALAFAPAAIKVKNLVIKDALVVTKSYPYYWEDLSYVGFDISPKIA